jgi:hypothetical protein
VVVLVVKKSVGAVAVIKLAMEAAAAAVFPSLAAVVAVKCTAAVVAIKVPPTFFPASAPQSPLALQQQQPRSVKWLGNSAAADSRAGDPGDHR